MGGIQRSGTYELEKQILSNDTSTSPVPFNLQVGSSGSQVTTVQTALLRLGYHITAVEAVNALFGVNTRKSVVEFQTTHLVPPTGIVDEGTAVILLDEASCAEQRRYVFGLVLQPNGTPGVDLSIKVFSRILRRELLLAETCSDDIGYYHTHYLPNDLELGGGNGMDLLVRVIRGDEILYDPTTTQLVYNAPDLTVINIDLVKGDNTVLDEYTSMLDSITPIIRDQEVVLSDLQQDDITFLAYNTGSDPIKITQIVVAAKMHSAYKLPGEFSYAVFVEGALSTFSQTSITGLRVQVGLSTNIQTLLYDMVLAKFASLTTAVQTAITTNIVPASLSDQLPSVQKILTQYTSEAEAYVKNSSLETMLLSSIQENLANGVADSLQAFFKNGAYGDVSYVLSSISAALTPNPKPSSPTTSAAPIHPGSASTTVATPDVAGIGKQPSFP
jgi:Putative peptidoglycan binding domain